MTSSGGWGVCFSNKNWEGGYNFFYNFFLGGGEGFSFETLHLLENHRPPDVINNWSHNRAVFS